MDIGIGLPTNLRNVDRDQVLAWARNAEQVGFSSLGMGERLTYDGYDWCVSLTAAAAVTTRIRLMSNVIMLPIHPVGVLAKQALSLDSFSHGRFVLGVGVGSPIYDYDVAVAPRENRVSRFEEHLVTLKAIWRGESQVGGLRPIGPPAVATGGPEILIGAFGPKGLRRVGEFADGLTTWSFPPDPVEVSRMFDSVRESWVDFGRLGSPHLIAGCYFSLGSHADDLMRSYISDYYEPFFSRLSIEELITSMSATSEGAVKRIVSEFEDIGCTEFMFQPVSGSIDQLDELASVIF